MTFLSHSSISSAIVKNFMAVFEWIFITAQI